MVVLLYPADREWYCFLLVEEAFSAACSSVPSSLLVSSPKQSPRVKGTNQDARVLKFRDGNEEALGEPGALLVSVAAMARLAIADLSIVDHKIIFLPFLPVFYRPYFELKAKYYVQLEVRVTLDLSLFPPHTHSTLVWCRPLNDPCEGRTGKHVPPPQYSRGLGHCVSSGAICRSLLTEWY